MASDSLLTEVTALPYAARFKSLREAGLDFGRGEILAWEEVE